MPVKRKKCLCDVGCLVKIDPQFAGHVPHVDDRIGYNNIDYLSVKLKILNKFKFIKEIKKYI